MTEHALTYAPRVGRVVYSVGAAVLSAVVVVLGWVTRDGSGAYGIITTIIIGVALVAVAVRAVFVKVSADPVGVAVTSIAWQRRYTWEDIQSIARVDTRQVGWVPAHAYLVVRSRSGSLASETFVRIPTFLERAYRVDRLVEDLCAARPGG